MNVNIGIEDHARSALAALVADEPALPAGTDDIEARGQRLRKRRRLTSATTIAVALAATLALTVATVPGNGSARADRVAAPTAAATDNVAAKRSQTFTAGMAFAAASAMLPAGVVVGQPLAELSSPDGGTISFKIFAPDGSSGTLTFTLGGTCTATVSPVGFLPQADLPLYAERMCVVWRVTGQPATNGN